ncbi:MAG: flagellar basal body rod protein [Bacillus sp. (in: firmicutes)]
MKKFGLFIIGGIAAIVLLVNFVPMLGLAISLGIGYLVLREFLKAKSTGAKLIWGLIGLMVISVSISNLPSIIGLVAAFVLYVVYKKWNERKVVEDNDSDPFSGFEKEWAKLNK